MKLKTARWWDVLWAVWVLAAVFVAAFDHGDALMPLAASFFVLELPGVRSRVDPYLPLTLELQAHSPGWLTFVLLGAGMWRLSQWVPSLVVFVLSAWLVWHFVQTYAARSHESVQDAAGKMEERLP